MKLKEKIRTETAESVGAAKKTINPGAAVFLAVLWGFLAAGTKLGGRGVPLCTALTAVLPPAGGFSAFVGAMGAFFVRGTIASSITEIISMPAAILSRALVTTVYRKKMTAAASGMLACASYILCGIIAAFSFKITVALIMAIFFRGIICGAAAFFAAKSISYAENGFGLTPESGISVSVVYIILVCMICGVSFGTINAGRVVGAFFTLAAAFRFGISGGGIAAALSAFAFGAASPAMTQSASIIVCGGIASGLFFKKNKLFSAAVFLGTALVCSLIYGMPSDSAKLILDMTFASAIFCVVPEKIFRKPLGKAVSPPSAAMRQFGRTLKFAASAVSDVKVSFSKAANVLDKGEQKNDIASAVCGKVCRLCRSSAFCGESEEHRIDAFFRPAENILEGKGFLTEKDLHKTLECCPQKNLLAEAFNEFYRLSQIEKRFDNVTDCMREITLEQLAETEEMLDFLGRSADVFPSCDEVMSEYVREELEKAGAKAPSAAVLFDMDGRIYIECFFEGMLKVTLGKFTEKLSEIADRELAEPAAVTLDGITQLKYHEFPKFEAEVGHAKVSGKEKTSGDSDAVFRDGFGCICILLSDGMGSGVRAAVESCMTVSLMTRIIRAGLGTDTAVKMINRLLITKSSEEIFSTIDLLKINLFTGKAEIIKLGAAQTFFKTNGTVKTVESWSTPVGIVNSVEISKRSIQLSDGDCAVMITDGICEEFFPRVRELMLSIGITAQECAERIISAAETDKENNVCRQDDKTVFVVKLHKN